MDERQEFAFILQTIRGSTFTRLLSFPMQVKSVHLLLLIELIITFYFAGVHNTFYKLLPENVARKSPMWSELSKMKQGRALLGVYIGMKGTDKELGITPQNVLVAKTNDFEKVNNILLE